MKKTINYPSVEQPWQKYYTEDAIKDILPECSIYEYLWENNKERLSSIALNYFGKQITYEALFRNIKKTAAGFAFLGIKKGDIVTIFSSNTPETVYCIYALNYIGAVSNLEYVTQSSKEAVAAVKRCNSKVVVILETLLSKFADIANLDNVDTIVSLPLSAQMPFF